MSWKNAIRMMTVALALMAAMALPGPASAQVAIGISVGFAPPEIPVYEQPICPGEGYIWTPGYWAWDGEDEDYYWVPGTWVLAPEPGYLWTPGYWGWGGSAFFFHEGYWGPVVGFYGGINYGFGYFGRGYEGGRWDHDRFYYNTRINNVNTTIIHNTYNTTIVNRNETRVSYNGGNGGINARATSQEEAAARERHIGAIGVQQEHVQAARSNRELRASENHGRPPIAATARPGSFSGVGVVAARSGGNYNPPANRSPRNNERTNADRNNPGVNNPNRTNNAPNRAENNPNRPPNATNRNDNNANRPPNAGNRADTYSHSREVPQHSAPQADANANQKYQQQQEKLIQKQNQEHQKLQQRQEQEHQRATQQRVPESRQQQMEQKHQQQTQQMEQKHTQQQQKVQQREAPPPRQSEKRPPNEKHP